MEAFVIENCLFIELIVCSNYHVAMLTEICLTETLLT